MEVDGRQRGDVVQDALRRVVHEVLRAHFQRHAVRVARRVGGTHHEQVLDVPALLFDELGVAAEAAGGEHDRLAVVLHHAIVAFRIRAHDGAVLLDERRGRRVEVHLDAQLVHALDHGVDVADLALAVLEPVERGVQAAVVLVDDAAVHDALLQAPLDVLGRLRAEVHPQRAVLAMLAAFEFGFDDLGRRHVDALLLGHLRPDGEHALDEAGVAAQLGAFLDEDEVRLVERRLHRAGQAAAAAAHDEQIGVVGLVHLVVGLRASRGIRLRVGRIGFLLRRRASCQTTERRDGAHPGHARQKRTARHIDPHALARSVLEHIELPSLMIRPFAALFPRIERRGSASLRYAVLPTLASDPSRASVRAKRRERHPASGGSGPKRRFPPARGRTDVLPKRTVRRA